MSSDHSINSDELSEPAVALIEKIEAVLSGVQPGAEVRTWYRRGEQRWVEEQAQNLQNINDITDKALLQLNEDANPDVITEDWFTYFFEKSQMESDSELQDLWACILAGEANIPGTYTKTTINFISELDEIDIELFTQLCDFAWKIGDESAMPLVFDEKLEIYNKHEITPETLTHLDNIGLIRFQTSDVFKLHLSAGSVIADYYGSELHLRMSRAANNEFEIGKVLLTPIGEELARICESEPVDGFYEYVKDQWQQYLI